MDWFMETGVVDAPALVPPAPDPGLPRLPMEESPTPEAIVFEAFLHSCSLSPEATDVTAGGDKILDFVFTVAESDWLTPADMDPATNGQGEGDDEVDDVIVIGNPPPLQPGYPGTGGGSGSGGSGGSSGGSGGGDGGGGGQPDCGCPSNGSTPAQQAEARARAAEGAAVVMGQNWENQEYGGFVYRDNATGQLVMGAITGSAIGTWSPTADNMVGISSYGQIVGIVHSHGPNVVGSFHNYPSTGDWTAFDSLISMGAANLSTYYIVGADGQLREYGSNNRDHQTPGEIVSGC